MIRMRTVMITSIVASSALPMLPNGALEMCKNVNERDDGEGR